MTEPACWRFSAGLRRTQIRCDVQFEWGPCRLFGQTMIRHALLSGTVTAISFGVHGATTGSCLMAASGYPLPVAASHLRTGFDAIDLASITPPTDKNLRAAA